MKIQEYACKQKQIRGSRCTVRNRRPRRGSAWVIGKTQSLRT